MRFAIVAVIALAACTSSPNAAAPTSSLRVMTFNIQSGGGNLDGTVAAIRAEHPDVVALQEVDVHWADRSAFADQAAIMGERLGMSVAFAPIYHVANADASKPAREFGVALLSRMPIVRWRNDTLTRLSTQTTNATPSPAPGLLSATLDVRGTPVRVLVTHLDYRADPAVRVTQVDEMVAQLDKGAGPALVFGDMNATPDASELRPFFTRLQDAWVVAKSLGPGLTYPAEQPVKRIDYVLASREFRVLSAAVVDTKASDHRPVVVELDFRP